MFEEFYERLTQLKIVPVVVVNKVEDAEPLAHALMAGGIKSAEVTFRTACAEEAIKIMSEAEPEMCVGAGTVLNVAQAEAAVRAGSKFLVSPGFSPAVADFAVDKGVCYLPGCVTATEIMAALAKDIHVTKFFPAENYGGLATIKSLAAAFVGHKFMPTGGVSPKNVREYLGDDSIVCCGGTWMVKPALFADGDFSKVEASCREAMDLVADL